MFSKYHIFVKLCLLALISLMYSCVGSGKIKDGRVAFETKQFALAADLFLSEYRDAQNVESQAEIAFMLGQSFRRMNDEPQALLWYRQSYELLPSNERLLEYAYALKRAEQYTAAVRAFEELQKNTGRIAEFRKEISICKQAEIWKSSQQNSNFQVSAIAGNSSESEYGVYVIDENLILFTSDGLFVDNRDQYSWTGNRYSDLFVRNKKTGEMIPLGPPVNTDANEGAAVLSRDRKELYFTRCSGPENRDAYCAIFQSNNINDQWSEPKPISWSVGDHNDGHPWISANGEVLFFSSNRPNGQGGYDIWLSQRVDGIWQEPINLGPTVNTAGDEKFPTLDSDTLYFSSDGKAGMGGLDIFKTYLLADGRWAPPENLKAPVNSGGDDFGFTIDRFSKVKHPVIFSGYLSSSRKGTLGSDDLFRFEYRDRVQEDKPAADAARLFVTVKVLEPQYNRPGVPNTGVKSYLSIADVDVEFQSFRNLDQAIQEVTSNSGIAVTEIDWEQAYRIKASKEGYLTSEIELDAVYRDLFKASRDSTVNLEVVLTPIIKGQEFILENIYYDFDRWEIRDDAKPTLNDLTILLFNNPGIQIELSAHTDCRGEFEYNKVLSQKRAQSAVDYIVSQGIASNRLVARGYGESQAIVDCECESCTEDQHQANRRTSFKILE